MTDRKFLTSGVRALLLVALAAAAAHGAKAPFELDIPDLERKMPTRQTPKKAAKPPKPSEPAEQAEEVDVQTGDEDVSIYTVRPGDFIFKILMRNYGLSNDQAERLIPKIEKMNHIANIRNLTVGQKIRIPLKRKSRGKVQEEAPETAPQEQQPVMADVTRGYPKITPPELPASPPEPTIAEKPVLPKPLPAEPVPQPKAEPAEKPVVAEQKDRLVLPKGTPPPQAPPSTSVDLSRYPTFPAADGGKIVLDLNGSLPSDVVKRLTEQQPGLRIVSGNPGKTKELLGKVLREAGFQEVNEDISLIFGVDPQVTVDADFRVVMKDPQSSRTEPVLIDATPSAPAIPALQEFLKAQNVRYIDLAGKRDRAGLKDETEVLVLQEGNRCTRLDALLDALKIPVERDRKVDLGGGMKLRLGHVITDKGRQIVLRCSNDDGIDYMTERLLELEGLSVASLQEEDPEKSALEILGRFRITPENRRHIFAIPGKETVKIAVNGLVVERGGKRLLLVLNPVEKNVRDLLVKMKPLM